MFHVALYQPEIPPNTGNIIRLCANTGSQLHLIHPLGFNLDDKQLRRAGLDYHEYVGIQQYVSFSAFLTAVTPARLFTLSTRSSTTYSTPEFLAGDVFLFGPETRGLPDEILNMVPEEQQLRVPMQPDQRSLNLSNAAAVVLYEAWRQHEFCIE